MRVMVNEECILCGLCVDLCPEVFELGDEFAFAKTELSRKSMKSAVCKQRRNARPAPLK